MSGQSLTEFLIGVSIATILVGGSVMLFQTAWRRTYCAKQAFEAAHHVRIVYSQGGSVSFSPGARITTTSTGVRAEASCGRMRETVELPLLEKARW